MHVFLPNFMSSSPTNQAAHHNRKMLQLKKNELYKTFDHDLQMIRDNERRRTIESRSLRSKSALECNTSEGEDLFASVYEPGEGKAIRNREIKLIHFRNSSGDKRKLRIRSVHKA